MTQRKHGADNRPDLVLDLQSDNRGQLTEEQISAIESFVDQVGGVDQARQALAALLRLEKAA